LITLALVSSVAMLIQQSGPVAFGASRWTPTDAASRLAQTSGAIDVPGLRAQVEIVRDRWGIPHIYAKNADDLFFAQGFVQAQDRLFQMDLWRRAMGGHLAEVLGAEYIESDCLARLLRYRGNMDAEWNSYAPDGKAIISQFVKGINAWIEIARRNPPLEFTIAGTEPGTWLPEDILSRAEGFLMSGNAASEVFWARFLQAVGPERASLLLGPDPFVKVVAPHELNLQLVDRELSATLNKIGTGASGFGQNLRFTSSASLNVPGGADEGSNDWVVSAEKSASGHPVVANDPHRALDHPSLRYIVHLNAPGWNVIGATQPWLPGVSIGHNDHVAWGLTLFEADTQDLFVEKLNPSNQVQYDYRGKWVDMERETDSIRVKGKAEPIAVTLMFSVHGPIIAVDAQRNAAFALRWTGAEPGSAGYLGGIGIDRARNAAEFREDLKRWKLPGENMVYADVDGTIGYQAAALTPIRKNWSGLVPVPGHTGEYEWAGFYSLDDLPHVKNPPAGFYATANNNTLPPGETRAINYVWSDPARINRIREVLTSKAKFTVDDFRHLQHDVVAWKAEQLVPLLGGVKGVDQQTEHAREMLLHWDRNVSQTSTASTLYVVWEQKLRDELAQGKVQGAMENEYVSHVGILVEPKFTAPDSFWFGPDPVIARNKALVNALTAAVAELNQKLGSNMMKWEWGQVHYATFRHLLAADPETQQLLNLGPFPRAGYSGTPFATGGRGFEQTSGASYREILDLGEWDRSVGTSAPGQSGQPGSPHFDDLAKMWAQQQYFTLAFSRHAVYGVREATLTLKPKR
jgi:penicillin amidase